MSYDRCLATLAPLTGKEQNVGYKKSAVQSLFDTTKVKLPLSFDRKAFFQQGPKATKGMSISGVQQKLSLRLNADGELEPTAEGGEYILKPSPEEYPNAAENEHAGMMASKLVGIPTAECALVAFSDGELAYLTRRFDRLADGNKVHQEDLLQIGTRAPDQKYDVSYEQAGELVDQGTRGKVAVKVDLFRRIVLAYAIGNNDLHMKNLSLQKLPGSTGAFFDRLTPNYDVLFTQAIENLKNGSFLACDLLTGPTKDEEAFTEHYKYYGFYTGYDFIALGKRYKLNEKVIHGALERQITKQPELLTLIENSYMPEEMKQEASELVTGRTKALSIGVSR